MCTCARKSKNHIRSGKLYEDEFKKHFLYRMPKQHKQTYKTIIFSNNQKDHKIYLDGCNKENS